MKRLSALTALLIASAAMLSSCGTHEPPHIEITETDIPGESDLPQITDAQLPDATIMDQPQETAVPVAPAYSPAEPASPEQYPSGFVANENVFVNVTTVQKDSGTAAFYMPSLRSDSEDAETVNSEINELTDSLTADPNCIGADFIYFRNTDLIFSFLITAHMADGSCSYRCYTFDTTEGTRLTNEEIMELTGTDEDNFYTYAVDAVIGFISSEYGSNEIFTSEGLNTESALGQAVAESDAVAEAYSRTFSYDTLNTSMKIFPNSDGTLCYITDIVSAEDGTTYQHAITSTGKEIASAPSSLMAGDECLADINFDNMCEYLKLTGDGSVSIYSTIGDTLTEIAIVNSDQLSYATAYMYEQSGYVGARVLRAELVNDASGLSYEMIVVSADYEIVYDTVISWSDTNGDGQIAEADTFTRDGEITGYAEWFDLTGIA